jgi:phosphoglycolate phosphatase-like HAD superfamily hydrolase
VIRLVLFDIDGTLIRTGGAGVRAFAQTAEWLFGRPGGTAKLDFAGRTDTAIIREFLTHHGLEVNSANVAHFLEAYLFLLHEQMERFPGDVCPGVGDFVADLQSLPAPPVLGLLTGNVRLGAEIKLLSHRMWHWFKFGAFGDDHEDRNRLAVVALSRGRQMLSPEMTGNEVLVVGDTPRDIECAAAIGARCLAVATGRSSVAELNAHSPDWAVETLVDADSAMICGR